MNTVAEIEKKIREKESEILDLMAEKSRRETGIVPGFSYKRGDHHFDVERVDISSGYAFGIYKEYDYAIPLNQLKMWSKV